MTVLNKLSLLFQRKRFDSELDEEMAFHRAQAEKDFVSEGMTPQQARYAGASANLLALSRRLAIVDGALQLDGVAVSQTPWTGDIDAAQFGLTNLCRVLFNLNEFSFVD